MPPVTRPPSIPVDQWEPVASFVTEYAPIMMSVSRAVEPSQLVLALTRVSTWAHMDMGYPLDADVIFCADIIGDWVDCHDQVLGRNAVLLTATHMLATGEHLGYAPNDISALTFSTPPTANPYTETEVAALTELGSQDPFLAVFLALTLGAGLRRIETAQVRGTDITVDELGVLVTVNGRTVPVLERFDEPLRARAGRGGYVLAPDYKHRVKVLSAKLHPYTSTGQLDSRRLVDTWVVTHLAAGIPDPVICQISGLPSLRAYQHCRPALSVHSFREIMTHARFT